MGNVFCFNYPF